MLAVLPRTSHFFATIQELFINLIVNTSVAVYIATADEQGVSKFQIHGEHP